MAWLYDTLIYMTVLFSDFVGLDSYEFFLPLPSSTTCRSEALLAVSATRCTGQEWNITLCNTQVLPGYPWAIIDAKKIEPFI